MFKTVLLIIVQTGNTTSRRMVQQIVVYSNSGILYSKENKQPTTTLDNMGGFHKCKVGQKEPDAKEDTLHDFIYIKS